MEHKKKVWIVRSHFNNELVMFNNKPRKMKTEGIDIWSAYGTPVVIHEDFLPYLKKDDDPVEAEMIIKT